MDIKEIDIKKIKEIQLNILAELHQVCVDNDLQYSLAGGTLLGAVRHKGYIPWDDDIDVIMTRKNYEMLIDFYKNNNTKYKLIAHEVDNSYGYLAAKIIDKETILEEINCNNNHLGVYIDIFPIDYLGDTYKQAVKNLNSTRFLRELLVARNWKNFFRSRTKPLYYEPIRFTFYILSRFTSVKALINKINKKNKKFSRKSSKFAGCICGVYRKKEIMDSTTFNNYELLEFENKKFSCITMYDNYLKSLYGEYMKLPPKEKQVSHHSFKAYYK